MTSSFSDKGRAAVLDRSAEISRSEILDYNTKSFRSSSLLQKTKINRLINHSFTLLKNIIL